MSSLSLVPGRRERLGDQLYGQILEQIVSGVLNEGDKLPSENEICRSFHVSRPTVREALMRLHADGLVVTRQGSGTFVQRRPPDQLIQLSDSADVAGMLRLFEVRIALEGQAAVLAAQRRTAGQMERIKQALAGLSSAFDSGEVPPARDLEFHLAIASASGNPLFADLLHIIEDSIRASMTVALGITRGGSKERARRVVEEHELIAEAILRQDSEGAGLAMRYHLYRARQRVTDAQRDK